MRYTLPSNATELQSEPISTTTPTNGQALIFNGTEYVPGAAGGGGLTHLEGNLGPTNLGASPTLITTPVLAIGKWLVIVEFDVNLGSIILATTLFQGYTNFGTAVGTKIGSSTGGLYQPGVNTPTYPQQSVTIVETLTISTAGTILIQAGVGNPGGGTSPSAETTWSALKIA